MGYKLTYPSGTATAMLINSFHTNTGAELARQEIHCYVPFCILFHEDATSLR